MRINTKLLRARKDASDQVEIGFDFESDWFRKWHEFCGPIMRWKKGKPKTTKLSKGRENAAIKSRLVSVLNLIGLESGASFLDQSWGKPE